MKTGIIAELLHGTVLLQDVKMARINIILKCFHLCIAASVSMLISIMF